MEVIATDKGQRYALALKAGSQGFGVFAGESHVVSDNTKTGVRWLYFTAYPIDIK
jgi:hypothetical protein